MPIKEFFDGPNKEITWFHVTDLIEVYDGDLAHAINHLYNHQKALLMLSYDGGAVGSVIQFLAENHPRLSPNAKAILELYNTSETDSSPINPEPIFGISVYWTEPDRDQLKEQRGIITRTLQGECQLLFSLVIDLSQALALSNADNDRARADKIMMEIANIPFIDFRYDKDPPPSIPDITSG
jgi:hypothetical protein